MRSSTPTETWIDLMPAIPLARGVPVVLCRGVPPNATHPDGKRVVTSIWAGGDQWFTGSGSTNVDTGEHRYLVVRQSQVRVDLDDPQGFGYALRTRVWPYLMLLLPQDRARFARVCGLGDLSGGFPGVRSRHYDGQTTDADRLALARALREVTLREVTR